MISSGEKDLFVFLIIEKLKENNYVSCELSFTCIFFFSLMLVNLVHFLGCSYFTLEVLFSEVDMMLFGATRALVTVSFPACYRGHH